MKVPVPVYKGVDLEKNEMSIIDIFEKTAGPVDYFDAKKKSKMKAKEYRTAFNSLWEKGAIKKQSQGGMEFFILAYEK